MRKIMLSLVTIIFLAVVGLRNNAKAQVFSPPPEFQKPLPILSEYSGEYAEVPNVRDQDSDNFIVPTSPEGYERWSTITYRSFQDNNLEIYTANGDGGNPQRLTVNNAVDTYPRLNRGATEIVFSSNRDGNNEIYKMKVDGSNATRLTNNEFNDTTPVWSPDNAQIAFAALPDNNWEIMVINADGTGLSARTQDAEIYDDLFPTWSPDGTKIAWTRFDQNGGRLYVMDANGGNAHPITDYIPYIQIPAWSPDGTYIAVDGDIDGDYWNEIILVQVSTGTVTVAYDSNWWYIDSWMGGWSPDGKYIIFTRVEYVVIDNQLYLNHTYLERIQVNPLSPTSTRIEPIGYELFPDWQSADLLAPTSYVSPLPDYSRAAGFSVNWSGIDPGPANIKGYDVQYQINQDGIWVDWASETTETSETFIGNPGGNVQFRSRARDEAGNLGIWSTGSGVTTLFTWNISGAVFDTRAYPVGLQPINISPTPKFTPLTDLMGNFLVYLKTQGITTLSVAKNGYAVPVASQLAIYADTNYSFVLPPIDDQLQNGDFESKTFTGWQIAGQTLPVLNEEHFHSGQLGATLGEQFASYVQRKNIYSVESGSTADSADVVVDAEGLAHLVWETRVIVDESQIMYTTCSKRGICQPNQVLFNGIDPRIALDSNGYVHLVWREDDVSGHYINYAHQTSAGTWSTPEHVAEVEFINWRGNPDLAVGPDNAIHVTWDNAATIFYRTKSENGSWHPIEQVTTNDGKFPAIAVDASNNVHIAWAPNYAMSALAYNMRPANGSWGVTQNIITLYASDRPGLAVNTSGKVYVAWTDFSYAYIVYKDLSNSWSNIMQIPQSEALVAVKIVASGDGRIFAFWDGQYFSYLDENDNWGPVRTLSGTWPNPSVPGYVSTALANDLNDFTSSGLAIIGFLSTNQVWNTLGLDWLDFPRETGGQTMLTQVLTIPEEMHQPTLSMLYISGSENPSGFETMALRIIDENKSTQLTTFPYADVWEHLWFDVSSWSGQTITISYELTRTLDGNYTWLYLDDISLGSWLTPLPETFAPIFVDASTPFSITITGENFIATPQVKIGNTIFADTELVDANMLTVQISSGLSPGWYRIWVINPSGQAIVLPGWLSVGKQSFLPIIFR